MLFFWESRMAQPQQEDAIAQAPPMILALSWCFAARVDRDTLAWGSADRWKGWVAPAPSDSAGWERLLDAVEGFPWPDSARLLSSPRLGRKGEPNGSVASDLSLDSGYQLISVMVGGEGVPEDGARRAELESRGWLALEPLFEAFEKALWPGQLALSLPIRETSGEPGIYRQGGKDAARWRALREAGDLSSAIGAGESGEGAAGGRGGRL